MHLLWCTLPADPRVIPVPNETGFGVIDRVELVGADMLVEQIIGVASVAEGALFGDCNGNTAWDLEGKPQFLIQFLLCRPDQPQRCWPR